MRSKRQPKKQQDYVCTRVETEKTTEVVTIESDVRTVPQTPPSTLTVRRERQITAMNFTRSNVENDGNQGQNALSTGDDDDVAILLATNTITTRTVAQQPDGSHDCNENQTRNFDITIRPGRSPCTILFEQGSTVAPGMKRKAANSWPNMHAKRLAIKKPDSSEDDEMKSAEQEKENEEKELKLLEKQQDVTPKVTPKRRRRRGHKFWSPKKQSKKAANKKKLQAANAELAVNSELEAYVDLAADDELAADGESAANSELAVIPVASSELSSEDMMASTYTAATERESKFLEGQANGHEAVADAAEKTDDIVAAIKAETEAAVLPEQTDAVAAAFAATSPAADSAAETACTAVAAGSLTETNDAQQNGNIFSRIIVNVAQAIYFFKNIF